MRMTCLIAGAGEVRLFSKMTWNTASFTVLDTLQNASATVFKAFLRLSQFKNARLSCLFVC